MASGFIVTARGDLDTIFKALSSGGPGPGSPTGLKVGSQDLANRYTLSNNEGYDKISYNSSFKSKNPAAGAPNGDLRYIFAYYGY